MRCLITGGAGFIGSHLAERLVADGHTVCVLDDLSTGRRENLTTIQQHIDLLIGNVQDAATVAKAVANVDWVFHLAALVSVPKSFTDPAGCFTLNTDATLKLAIAAKTAGASRFVFASSSAVYGDAAVQPIAEDSPTNPLSPYAESKLRAEEGLWPLAEPGRFEPVALRFFNVYGPRQPADSPYSGVIVRFLHQLERGEPITLFGDGEQTRDFVHVSDVAEFLRRAARLPATSVPATQVLAAQVPAARVPATQVPAAWVAATTTRAGYWRAAHQRAAHRRTAHHREGHDRGAHLRADRTGAAQSLESSQRVFNVGTGRGVSLNELVTILGRVTGRRLKPKHAPARPGDVRHSRADVDRACQFLSFTAEVKLRTGLTDLFSATRERRRQ